MVVIQREFLFQIQVELSVLANLGTMTSILIIVYNAILIIALNVPVAQSAQKFF